MRDPIDLDYWERRIKTFGHKLPAEEALALIRQVRQAERTVRELRADFNEIHCIAKAALAPKEV